MGDRIFVGRDQEMVNLHALLRGNDRVAIAAVGMSGVGKTTLARHYVMQHGKGYPGGGWWVSARSVALDVLGHVERMGMRSELPTDWSESRIVQYYFDRWHQRFGESKLLVLDDVSEYLAVKEFLPNQGSFQVLMTTKVKFGSPVKRLDLDVLAIDDAMVLLRSHMGNDEKSTLAIPAAIELCEWLGRLPLAIELVGRYLNETGTIEKVLGQLKAKALAARAISEVPGEMDYELNVRDAIELSWEPLSEDARRVAMVLGVFALGPIEGAWVQDCLGDGEEVEEILDLELVKRSWVEKTEEGYRLHSLVREFLREKLDGEVNARKIRLKCGPVMMAVTSKYYDQTSYYKAIPFCQRSLEIYRSELGDRHLDTATSLSNLAELYRLIGRYDLAEPLYLESIAIRRDQLDSRHLDIAESLNNLAGLYLSMGRYDLAEPLYLESIAIRRDQLDGHHLDIAQSLNNLAELYRFVRRYELAEPFYLEAIVIIEEQLGNSYLFTALILNNLALLYRLMNRHDIAELLHLKSISIKKGQLDDRHLDIAVSLHNLAALYQSMSRYGEAEQLLLESISIRKEKLCDRHPDTAQSLHNLATLYYTTGRFPGALQAMLEALSIREKVLGGEHRYTVGSRKGLQAIQQAVKNQ